MTLAERMLEIMCTSCFGLVVGSSSCVRDDANSGEVRENDVTGFGSVELRDWEPMSARLRSTIACTVTAVVLLPACSDADRSGANFCEKLSSKVDGLSGPLATSDDISDLVNRYESLDAITPLAIRDDWHVITELLQTAEDVDYEDPRSRQDLADAAYKAERSARDVARWVESTCGIAMPDVIGVEGPDTTTAPTIAPTTTDSVTAPTTTAAPTSGP